MSTNPSPTPQQIFDDAYWASFDPKVQALRGMNPAEAAAAALTLAQAGYVIDVPIMVYQWDAFITMSIRQMDGLTWVPSALQSGIGFGPAAVLNPPFSPYDPNNPPQGSIKVSTNPADFKPFYPPTPAAAPATNVVGPLAFGNLYAPGPGAISNGKPTVIDGQVITQSGASYTAHVVMGLMGWSISFTKN